MKETLWPGRCIGVIGGGQLGRYLVFEARRLGYRSVVLDPAPDAPAMQVCDVPLVGEYDDAEALDRLAELADAVTIEFENVPAPSLERLAGRVRIAPDADAVALSQNRLSEKAAALRFGLEPVRHAAIRGSADIEPAIAEAGLPAILKTARLGYDGKGQALCADAQSVRSAWQSMGEVEAVLEQRVALAAEVSVVLARRDDGEIAIFPLAQNVHRSGILFSSSVPADIDEGIDTRAQAQAVALAEGLNYCGVLAVEFFVTETGDLLFNEMAPRPHNSGHYTLDATVASQFEQQLRVLCGLPLASTRLLTPVCMLNLLGDVWGETSPDWSVVTDDHEACLHLYGKAVARPGRKMGHVNCLASSAAEAERQARQLAERLAR